MPARGGGAPYSAAERARNAGAQAREGALKIYSRIAYRRQFEMGAWALRERLTRLVFLE
jgi:hypothetical protein